MFKLKNNSRFIIFTLAMMIVFMTCVSVLATADFKATTKSSSYVELYSPMDTVDISSLNPTYFKGTVEDSTITNSGKGLVLDYKAGYAGPLTVTIPTGASSADNFEGLAIWLDVPLTADNYSFTLYLENEANVWQTMELGSELTMITEDGEITTSYSLWKRQQLNGFRGWLLLPHASYIDIVPNSNGIYNFIFMIENEIGEGFYRTEDIQITIGSIGYYTDYIGVLYDFAGADSMVNKINSDLDGYIDNINNLKPRTNDQVLIKNEMLVYFSNLRENFATLNTKRQVEIASSLYDTYYAYMEDFLYGEIRKTDYVMSFAIMSDTHFTETWINERFLNALTDAKEQKPELAAALVLGDISDNGVSVTEKPEEGITTELDNYYNWLDSYEYKDVNGNDIPIINVLGNHDVRGHYKEKYPESSYEPAIDMYLEREKLAKEANSIQFDTWINGYHFIFLNTDKYHSDDCYLSGETLKWLDETLAENEDGRPIFVMVHQPLGKVHTMEGAEMTFEEVIARHPSAVVSSGHEHAPFGNAKITQEGNGVYVNQPAMVNVATQYYIVEVYEGGVIYRAREVSTDSWIISSDVVVANEDKANNVVFNSKGFDLNNLTTTNAVASIINHESVSGSALKLVGNTSAETISIPIAAMGNVTNYEGYALHIESDYDVSLSFDNKSLKANEIYYSISNGNLVEKKTDSNGKIVADGWVVIPKNTINGDIYPTKNSVLDINIEASQTIYLDQVSYYFDLDEFNDNVSNISYYFYNGNEVVLSKVVEYGAELEVPTDITKEATAQYTYEFKGWDIDGDGVVDELPETIKGNLYVDAVFEATIRQYTYTLYDVDGITPLVSKTVNYGTSVEEPIVDKLLGWDIDGDGAVENLPEVVTGDFEGVAIIGVPKYDNAEVIFDPSTLSEVSFQTSSWCGISTSYTYNALPVTNLTSPTGKVAQFTYNYKEEHTEGTFQITLATPYNGSFPNFQGYAIWVDIEATGEDYIGGINLNGQRTNLSKSNGFVLIDTKGNVTYQDSTYTNAGIFPSVCANGFTGWILIDKSIYVDSSITESKIAPSSTGTLQFRIAGGNRTTSYTISIGEVIAYNNQTGIISELSNKVVDTLEYSFSDGNGYIYKAGQISVGESIIIPENPTYEDSDVIFAGWDTNDDGYPDELPEDGKITESLKAVALFYHVDAFKSFNEGTSIVWGKEGSYISMTNVEHAGSPTGKAVEFDINKDLNASGVVYATLKLPTIENAKGVGIWMDASNVSSFGLRLWKNWIAKQAIGDNGDYVYLYGADDSLTKISGWRKLAIPNNFKGWVIIPLSTFVGYETISPGDYIRFGIEVGADGTPADFSGKIYFGEALTFNCTPEFFIKQIDKQVFGFKDYDDTFISGGVISANNEFAKPNDPVREGWRFVGWDIDGDGISDEIPVSIDRNFTAKAIYTKEFTYKFVDQNNNIILEKTAEYNSLVLPPFLYMDSDPNYVYTVEYIDYHDGILLTEDLLFHVNVTKEAKKYTIKFIDQNGNLLQESILDYGDMPVYNGQLPNIPSTSQYTYIVGWNKEITKVTEDTIYRITINEIVNKYKVIFYDEDNTTVLDEQMVEYGIVPTYEGKIPTKASDSKYTYTFVGWNKEITSVKGDATYTAVYSYEPIDGHYHDYSGEWQKDAEKHWKECECGEKDLLDSHDFVMIVIKEATETSEGLIEYKCGVCGQSYTETIPSKATNEANNGCTGSIYSSLLATTLLSFAILILKRRKFQI